MSSFDPPTNTVSCAFGSGLCATRPAVRRPFQSVYGAASSWSPSPPWNVLPVRGVGDDGRVLATAAGAAISRPTTPGRSARITIAAA
jgi:hypothetical protein